MLLFFTWKKRQRCPLKKYVHISTTLVRERKKGSKVVGASNLPFSALSLPLGNVFAARLFSPISSFDFFLLVS
jgi:hypothetical protein